MKQLFIYTYLEFKRFLKILPYFIAGSIILAVIANLTSFTAKMCLTLSPFQTIN